MGGGVGGVDVLRLIFANLYAFSFSACSNRMAQMSKADGVLCGGYKVKRVNKVKHVFVVRIREGQVQHE